MQAGSPIELVVCDIEGCITPPSGATPWPLELFTELGATIEKLGVPFILLSGRQVPYGEAIVQALNLRFPIPPNRHGHSPFTFFPMILENGCYFFDPSNKRSYPHPALSDYQNSGVRERLLKARRRLQGLEGIGFVEPGKDFVITISPLLPTPSEQEMEEMLAVVKAVLGDLDLAISKSRTAVDVAPPGLDKVVGLKYLLEVLEIPSEQVLGIGDAEADLSWLAIVGTSACPANATEDVKATVDYVASTRDSVGVREILLRSIV